MENSALSNVLKKCTNYCPILIEINLKKNSNHLLHHEPRPFIFKAGLHNAFPNLT